MKRLVFRTSIVGLILALGLLTIAHAQRTESGPTPDNSPANPLRDAQGNTVQPPAPAYAQPAAVGPVGTDLPPGDNPLRRHGITGNSGVRPVSAEEPQGQTPSQIRLINDGLPNSGTAGPVFGSAAEPQPLPTAADRYAVPVRPAGAQDRIPRQLQPPGSTAVLTSGDLSPGPRMLTPDPSNNYLPGSIREAVPYETSAGNRSPGNGSGQPGNKQLEGPQSPQIAIQKIAPPEIQVGRPAVLRLVVRNTGTVAASGVEIHDLAPQGTRLLGTAPPAAEGPRGELVWSLGTLKPGAETSVEMQIMPIEEGEVGSVATVRFQAEATARSRVTRPKLAVVTAGANRVLLGEETVLTFTVSNPGSGVATGVELAEHVPAGLKHPGGSDLLYNVGDLKPGESRQLQLHLKAVQPGVIANLITARAEANLHTEHRFNLEVTAPQLDLSVSGPKRRYLEREATYQFSVSNGGTAPAQQVELVAYLPQGLKFVNANNAGRYDAATRAVYWRMDELPIKSRGLVELVTLPIQPGQFSIKVRSAAQRGLVTEKEQPVMVEGLASVLFQLSHTKDPLEIGGETTYEISVVNQGSKASTNLQISVMLPAELKPVAADGPTRFRIENNRVVFEALPQLAPKTVAAFHVRAKGLRAGDLRVRCQLSTDDMQQPVVKEESTRVYADE